MRTNYDVAVIGAGIAGLTSAALLAHSGARVLLLEHHDKPGGCAGYFTIASKWGEFTFPTGATAAVGLESGGLHTQIFERLGVTCPTQPIEKLRVFLPDLTLDMHHDARLWQRERQKLSGNRMGQELFWKTQEAVADAGWFALNQKPVLPIQKLVDLKRNLALVDPQIAPMLLALPFSVGELMKWLRIDRDRAFCALVNLQLLITVQSLSHAAPLSNGMAGLDLWRHGAFHPIGGLGAIAQTLLEAFKNHGGQILFNTRAEKIERENNHWRVHTMQGEFLARDVVANVPTWNLGHLVDLAGPQQARFKAQQGQSWGAVNLYIAVREELLPAGLPLHSQVLKRYHSTPPYLKPGLGDDIFLSLSLPNDPASAPSGYRTLNISTHVPLSDWADLPRLEYRAQKKRWREKLFDIAQTALPNINEAKLFALAATPSSWEDYTLRGKGGVGGVKLTRKNANLRAQSQRIGLPNFHVVGDTTFPGQGTVACALSGRNAWRDIMGL